MKSLPFKKTHSFKCTFCGRSHRVKIFPDCPRQKFDKECECGAICEAEAETISRNNQIHISKFTFQWAR